MPVVILVLVALGSSFTNATNQLAQDDRALILADPRVPDASLWSRFLTEPYWPRPYPVEQYRPVTSLGLALQYAIGSGLPIVYRITNWILYAAVCVLFYRFALRILPWGVAFAMALLFAAHPVHVEVTALGVGQSEMIVAVCSLFAALHYHARRVTYRSLRPRDWLAIAVAYVVAALAKEQGLLIPALLLIIELTLIEERFANRLRLLWPGYSTLALIGLAIVLLNLAVLGESVTPEATNEVLANKGAAVRALTMLRTVPDWIRLLAWPAHLRVDYSPQEFVAATALGGREVVGLVLLVALGFAATALRAREPAVTLGVCWMAVMLFPVSNLIVVTGVYLAERTLFQPSVGFVLLVGGVAASVVRRAPPSWTPLGWPLAVMLVALLTALGVAKSAGRQRVYRDDFTLARAAVRDSPLSWRAHADLSGHYFDRTMMGAALAEYRLATDLAPAPWIFRYVFARRLRSVGMDSIALIELRKSLKEQPNQPEATAELIAALLAVGEYEEARATAHEVIRLHRNPPLFVALRQLSDSAIRSRAPKGTIRITIPSTSGR